MQGTPDPAIAAATVVGFDELAEAYLQDYELQGYRTIDSAKGRVAKPTHIATTTVAV